MFDVWDESAVAKDYEVIATEKVRINYEKAHEIVT